MTPPPTRFLNQDSGGGSSTFDITVTIEAGDDQIVAFAPLQFGSWPASSCGVVLDPGGPDEACFSRSGLPREGGSNGLAVHVWRLLEADVPSPGTYTLRAQTASGNFGSFYLAAYAVQGSDQGAIPAAHVNTTHQGSSSNVSTSVTTQVDDCVILDAVIGAQDQPTWTPEAAQTEDWQDTSASSAAGSTLAAGAAGAYTMEWDATAGHTAISHVVVAIAPDPDPDEPPGAGEIGAAVGVSDTVVRLTGLVEGSGPAPDTTELWMGIPGAPPFEGGLVETWAAGLVPADFDVTGVPPETLQNFALRSVKDGLTTDGNVVEAGTLPRPFIRTGVHEDECEFPLKPPPGKEIHRFEGITYQIGKHEDDGAGTVNETITVKIDGTQVEQFTHNDVPLVDPVTGQPLTVTQIFANPYTEDLDKITINHRTELPS